MQRKEWNLIHALGISGVAGELYIKEKTISHQEIPSDNKNKKKT